MDRRLQLIQVAALAGTAISAYLTLTHYQALPLACPSGGVVDCGLVTQSRYGVIPGTALPTSLLGILFFAGALALAAARRFGLLAAWCAGGLLVVLYLVYVELALLRHICEWCTAAHVLVLAMLLVAISRWQSAALANRGAET
ncbi:MAG TPA: vitamin K epoxide reductase family protein [Candidatus Dormibacteraeota bacterium]